MSSVTLARILIYPVKSLDGISVHHAAFTPRGGLVDDRRWALFDDDGELINGKRMPRVHDVRARYDLDARTIELTVKATKAQQTFSLVDDVPALDRWFSDFFDVSVSLREAPDGGFPDDPDAPGPTVVSTATLSAVASWFPGLTVDEVRQRFRANLELDCPEPFWEDRLYANAGELLRFQIGAVQFDGTNPCQRCGVPPRDPETGKPWPGFAKQFSEHREATLPSWANASRFDHFYRLSVNTRVVPGSSGHVAVGDEVRLQDNQPR